MSHLDFKVYPGSGESLANDYGYSQSVRVGNQVFISGQGGWEPASKELSFPSAIEPHVANAFKNCENALKDAGASMSQVYKVVSYHSPMTHESCLAVKAQFERHLPTHKPLWTAIGVASLALPEMQIEIELWADVSSNEGGKKQ